MGENLDKLLHKLGQITAVQLCSLEGKKVLQVMGVTLPGGKGPIILVLNEYQDVFAEPQGLQPQRLHNHKIPLKEGSSLMNIWPYHFSVLHKNVIEHMIREMLDSRIIR